MKAEYSLNGAWEMRALQAGEWINARVPGSVYADLLREGKMEDPFYRDNEVRALPLMEKDWEYRRAFDLPKEMRAAEGVLLRCEGLDTLCDVFVNGERVLSADNMHRTWEAPLRGLKPTGNEIRAVFLSPVLFMRKMHAEAPIGGANDCINGYPYLRKAHCMSGWDWGPRLPDAGIWRDIKLVLPDQARLGGVLIRQEHDKGRVTLRFAPDIARVSGCAHCDTGYEVRYSVTAPDGARYASRGEALIIERPQLWWPCGYGEQPLYAVRAELSRDGRLLDVWERRIGLRTLTVTREKDAFGEGFAATVNGVRIFCMGADYIPEDNLLSRVTPERTRALLRDCRDAHFNCLRVWGGGYYPDDFFFDLCDEAGLLIWQDLMFACSVYRLSDAFYDNIRAEFVDNITRIRHHACLLLICGNNEIEQLCVRPDAPAQLMVDYIRMFEDLAPGTARALAPDTFYWPSSPSSGVTGDHSDDPNRGDVHYWDVWHGGKPFPSYRKFFFRFASEFGFQSFPCKKTVESFTLPEDRNIFSYVMEKHQRNNAANGKIIHYLSATFLYPGDFDTLLYASQLLQAEAIRYGVEHWRRNRGRCMGAIYWQLNDCWPVASWASIDYFGRWKALHYAAKRFFAPVLLSCEEEGTLTQNTNVNAEPFVLVKSARLNVSNETRKDLSLTVRWALRTGAGGVLRQGECAVAAPALSAVWLDTLSFPEANERENYFSYALYDGETELSRGTALFIAPKHYAFHDPHLRVERAGEALTVTADAYARSVEIVCEDGDCVFSDNYFDLNADSRTVRILRGGGTRFTARSVYDIR